MGKDLVAMKHPHVDCLGVQRPSTTKLFGCLSSIGMRSKLPNESQQFRALAMKSSTVPEMQESLDCERG